MSNYLKTVSPKRRAQIIKYLTEKGCSPSLSGFNVLLDVISLSCDNNELGCQELFNEYSRLILETSEADSSMKQVERNHSASAYKAAHYCITKSDSKTKKVYNFIKTGALICSAADAL